MSRIRAMVALGAVGFALACGAGAWAQPAADPPRVRDILWVWGNPEMGREGVHSLAGFAEAPPADRARLLTVPNVIMAGEGLPADDAEATALTEQVADRARLVWEITHGDVAEGSSFTFEFTDTVARVGRLAGGYPAIEGVLLDDMSSMMIPKGLTPEHVRALRESLKSAPKPLALWGVLYSMNFDIPNLDRYIDELDVINLWIWHARDIPSIEAYVAECERRYPGKPIVLGLYLYDYGEGRRMPMDLLRQQCATGLRLAHEGRVAGLVFLTINNDAEAVTWTKGWIDHVGDQPLGSRRGTTLTLDDPADWRFLGGEWTQREDGTIVPQDTRNLHSRAFHQGQAFGDVDIEFEFNGNYRETGTGCAGVMLRAAGPNQFYYVYFPWGGQQLRAKHFWAVVAKVDGDGYLRNLDARWVPGVPSETDRWYAVRVSAKGPDIEVWVDGRRALAVTDDAYASGAVGLAGYGWYAFRNVYVSGTPAPVPAWDDAAPIPTHAFEVGLSSAEMPSGLIAPNGDVLLAAGNQLVRSTDQGRTWGPPETLPEAFGVITDYGSAMFRPRGGPVKVMLYRPQKETEQPTPEIAIAESPDNGLTWSEPVTATVAPDWPAQPANLVPYGPVVENAEGALLRFLLGNAMDEEATFTDVRTWSATHCRAFVIRSTDGGMSWSAPIELDRPSWVDTPRGGVPGSLDLTEPVAVVTGDTVMALIRPIYSVYMWQCWSYDGGATWDSASRATFPGYAPSMARTASGAIVCAHRFPLYSANVSRDGGLNWDAGTVIDYPVWAMGCMLEVEPDVVLCVYMNAERGLPLLAQRIRVTPEGLRPATP